MKKLIQTLVVTFFALTTQAAQKPGAYKPLDETTIQQHKSWLQSFAQQTSATPPKVGPSTSGRFPNASPSHQYPELVSEILKLKTADQVENLISQWTAKKGTELDANSHLAVAHMNALKNFRGIFERLSPILQQSRLLQSWAYNGMKFLKSQLDVQCPAPHCQAVWDYLVSLPKDSQEKMLSDVGQVQSFLFKQIETFKTLAEEVHAVSMRGGREHLYVDLRLVYSPTTFSEDQIEMRQHLKTFMPADLYFELGDINQRVIAPIYLVNAYHMDELSSVINRYSRKYSLATFLNNEQSSFAFPSLVGYLKKEESTRFMTLRDSAATGLALEALVAGQKQISQANGFYKNRSDDNLATILIRPSMVWSDPSKTQGEIDLEEKVLKGEVGLKSMVTGQIVRVNLAALFTSPPKDLRSLFPETNQTPKFSVSFRGKMGGEKVLKSAAGRSIRWGSEYKKIFPDFDTNSPLALPDRVRTLREAWAGGWVASLLTPML